MLQTLTLACTQIGEPSDNNFSLNNLFNYCPCLAGFLDRLTEQNLSTQSFRFAKASAKNIISGIRSWVFFCIYFDLEITPASVQNLVWFLELNSLTSGYAHVKHLLRSVHFLHEATDTPFPTKSFEIETTLHGLK